MAIQYKYLDSFINELRSNGKYSFTTEGLPLQLGVSENALKKSLQRLQKQNLVVKIRRGFYVIVPPEYSANGIIPSSFFLGDLMKFLNRNYYIGLLNAAAFYGAAHQQPQSYSVITEGIALRSIINQKFSIHFYTKNDWNKTEVVKQKVDTGYVQISSPALTILDLVHHFNEVGGFNRVATVIEELKDLVQPNMLLVAASHYKEVSTLQRLGYLLEYVLQEKELSTALFSYLESLTFYPILLRPQKQKSQKMITRNKWKIVVNIEVEADI